MHSETWVARPTASTGFGFADFGAVSAAFADAFTHATEDPIKLVGVRLVAGVPVDRRYVIAVDTSDGHKLTARLLLDDTLCATAEARLIPRADRGCDGP